MVATEKGDPIRRRRRAVPAETPNALWPGSGASEPDHNSSLEASRRAHPSYRARRLTDPSVFGPSGEPLVILASRGEVVDLSDCGNGCGRGVWCDACRADIRAEALRWLRELNVAHTRPVLAWARAWHQELMLAD